jgi:hypothetical protein
MSWKLEKNGYIKTWAQDSRNSYKIKLKYFVVPKGVKNELRFIDTPYRFQSFQEAREYAKELFPCNAYVIEGSGDKPNFNETQFIQRATREEVYKSKDYDLYGVKPNYIQLKSNGNNSLKQKLEDIDYLRKKLDAMEKQLISTNKLKNT